jgi:hypothetical protein
MGQQTQVHKRSVYEKKEQSTAHWRIPILAIGLTALVLVALAVLTVTPAGKPAMLLKDGDPRFVTNPELLVVQRYTQAAAKAAQTAFRAANPELVLARRYAGPLHSESSLFAANPELMIARRYTGPLHSESSLFAANPELMAARRYTGPLHSESSLFAANPELMAARRYTARVVWNSESSFLAANPELMISRRHSSTLWESATTLLSGSSQ